MSSVDIDSPTSTEDCVRENILDSNNEHGEHSGEVDTEVNDSLLDLNNPNPVCVFYFRIV